ncbi:hypothetical protein [Streptomyces sp. ML-6]|uniref:zinc finger domain-containing protein n=1 Tax=Streptomyces sp. ML-6 TaxID=2982693 RepID=UPI0024C0162E|nr:hypothetical protein [Streptomyces sp. ML-6]MDK0520364.1 hypothetical protein [Streptomyces sp. ML-6]
MTYHCDDCDATMTAPTDTDTIRCPGCGEMASKTAAMPANDLRTEAGLVSPDKLARMLNAADIEADSDCPTWWELHPDGRAGYAIAADYLLARLHITAPTERPAAEVAREQRDNISFNRGNMVAALRDALLDPARHTPASATAAAYVLLAAHARQLATAARVNADQLNAELRAEGDRRRTGIIHGMLRVVRVLDSHADQLAAPPEEQPAAPAAEHTLTAAHAAALAVDCPACESPAGQFCTSHNGTRQRRHDVHQARTKTHREQAGR